MADAIIPMGDATHIIIRPLSADELPKEDMGAFR